MISKERFVNIIETLKETNDFVEETNEKAMKLQDAIRSDFFNAMSLSISHEDIVIQLLENMFNDEDIISWWLYDLDYGRKFKIGCIQEEKEGKIVKYDLSNAEKLYDYLVDNMEEKNG